MTKEKAIKVAQERYGPKASAFIIAGVRYVSTDPHKSTLGPGWLHFDGQGKTWKEAFEDAEKRLALTTTCTCGIGDDLLSASRHAMGCPRRIDD